MSLFITMFPIYILGNFHCIGMCGPLVMMLGSHPYRYWYFTGRATSFTCAGALAGSAGTIVGLFLQEWYIPAAISLLFGLLISTVAICSLLGRTYPGRCWLGKRLGNISQNLSLLLLREEPFPAYLFGMGTLLLPCGQTIIVFSACALYGDALTGALNGAAFAILTTPSLWIAMHAQKWLPRPAAHYQWLFNAAALLIGIIAVCRGLAEINFLPHLILNEQWHLVVF